jgi:hypothetical protein
MPSSFGSLSSKLFNDKANIKIPKPTINHAIITGPGAAARARSDGRPNTPPPIDELITSAHNGNKPIFLGGFFSDKLITSKKFVSVSRTISSLNNLTVYLKFSCLAAIINHD